MRFIAGAVISILSGLVLLFFEKYNGTIIPYPALIYLGAFLLLLAGLGLMGSGSKIRKTGHEDHIARLKSTGKAIRVDLTKCRIKSNTYTEEQERYPTGTLKAHDIQFGNAIMGEEMKNVKLVEVNQSVIEYIYNGRKYYSGIIPKDKITLSFLLEHKKETNIYFDPQTGNYYFDLEFLSDKKE